MVYRTNGYVGCLVGIIVLLLIFSIFRFAGWLVFGTPVGLVLVGYLIYRHFKNQKQVEETRDQYFENQTEFDTDEPVVDVDFEEVDSDN